MILAAKNCVAEWFFIRTPNGVAIAFKENGKWMITGNVFENPLGELENILVIYEVEIVKQ